MDELITGVVSGLVATFCFTLLLFLVKPRIRISGEICKDPDYENIYRIKVVNTSRAIINNLHYSLHYYKDVGDGIKEIWEIAPRKSYLSYISQYTSHGEDDYAVRISFVIDSEEFPFEDAFFEFNIMANHSLSGTMACAKRRYTAKEIKEGVFETGKSMKILLSNRTKNISKMEQQKKSSVS